MHTRGLIAALLAGYLGLYNGYLALWNDNSREPAHIFPYRAESYSISDQEALRKRIPFQNRSELTRLLEDYLS